MKIAERAMQAWHLLVCVAQNQNKRTLKYTEVEQLTGMARQGLGDVFLPVLDYCKTQKYPQLTVIVISENGQPSNWTGTPQELEKETEKVFNFDWLNATPPQMEDLGG